MTDMSRYMHGQFSWIDLMTPDLRASRMFYCELFDWDMVDHPSDQAGLYVEFQFGGRSVAGMGAMPAELRNSGMPAVWSSYIDVDDVDATVEEAEALGATIEMPPTQVMAAGRMAILTDPVGAQISLWQAGEHIGAALVNHPTSLCWNELVTSNIDESIRFYRNLFDWKFRRSDDAGSTYYEILNEDRENGGMIEMTDDWGATPPHWMPYISVLDCDETIEKAIKLGATVEMDPIDIETGRFCVIIDPQGAPITAIKLDDPT
ncbi:MAG: VOC family protein [Deltaproteobacteria bacterium]|nr:VOC family protein [Deltaproteobacteria bacterium]MBW2725946.1 VOC family protein [Deltaproteobacteria bacterium]